MRLRNILAEKDGEVLHVLDCVFDGPTIVFVSSAGEGETLREAQNQPSELVREFAETRGTGFGIADRPDEIERETMAALAEAGRILDEKAPDEKEAYRSFVLEVAQSVADAAGGGEAPESATIEKIRVAL